MGSQRRVAITGLGAITPIGNTADEFWQALIAGRSGARLITQFDASQLACRIATEVEGFESRDHFDTKVARRVERFAQFAVIAAREAYAQSGLGEGEIDPEDIGCLIGVGIGGIGYTESSCHTLRDRGSSRVNPFLIPKIIGNMAPAQIAIDLGLKGPNMTITTACAAGCDAIGHAAAIIQRGDAKAMIAGGAESAVCPIAVAGFDKMKALCSDSNDDPARGSRPFDATRSGFVFGEGSGALVLEDYELAEARGATILAELRGYGQSSDAFHVTAPAPHGEGAARAIARALDRAGLDPTEVGYVNAHGTSTQLNDKFEIEAIKTVFGDHASKLAISSNKSMIGHLLGAAGAVEAVATVYTLREQMIPPTINLSNPDPECDLDCVPNTARKVEGIGVAISNSFGFGGHNGCIVISRVDGS